MTWFRIDDYFYDHPKVAALEEEKPRVYAETIALWTIAGTYCARHLTDGVLSTVRTRRLVPFNPKRAASALVSVGLWEQTENGFRFKSWTEWQPSRAKVLAKREEEAAKKRGQRGHKPAVAAELSPRDTEGDSQGESGRSPGSEPDPTRPDPVQPSASADADARPTVDPPSYEPPPLPVRTVGVPPKLASKPWWRVGEAYRQRLLVARQGEILDWTKHREFREELESIAGDCAKEPCGFDEALERTLTTYFAEPWVRDHSYPLRHLAKHWHRYFAPPKSKRGPLEPAPSSAFEALAHDNPFLDEEDSHA